MLLFVFCLLCVCCRETSVCTLTSTKKIRWHWTFCRSSSCWDIRTAPSIHCYIIWWLVTFTGRVLLFDSATKPTLVNPSRLLPPATVWPYKYWARRSAAKAAILSK